MSKPKCGLELSNFFIITGLCNKYGRGAVHYKYPLLLLIKERFIALMLFVTNQSCLGQNNAQQAIRERGIGGFVLH